MSELYRNERALFDELAFWRRKQCFAIVGYLWITQEGKIAYAFANADYRLRAELSEIVKSLA